MLMGPAYLLQLVPVLNLLLVFLLSPLWIAGLLNAALVTMVLDVRRRASPRWLLAVPILVYGGNLAYSAAGYVQYRLLDARLHRENGAQRLAFDAERTDLVAPRRLAEALVNGYAIPVVHADGDGRTSLGAPASLRILPKAVCDTIARSPDGVMTVTPAGSPRARVDNACLLRLPGRAERPAVRVTRDPPEDIGGPTTRLTLTAPDGRGVTLVRGQALVPFPIPLPLVGCVTWTSRDCVAQFVSLPLATGGRDDAETGMVAAALGLKPRRSQTLKTTGSYSHLALDEAQTEALAAGSEPAVAEARAYGAKVVDKALARFRRLMAGQDLATGETFDSWIVVSNADKLDGEADTLMAAIERDAQEPARTDNMRIYGKVAAALPAAAFDRIGPRLAAMVETSQALRNADGLVVRLGDLGKPAVPALARIIDDAPSRELRRLAALGLCRAGEDARPSANEIVSSVRIRPDPDVNQAVVLALLRMDRPDLARSVADQAIDSRSNAAGQRRQRDRIDQALHQVSSASPRSACQSDRSDRPLPNLPWLD